MALSLTNLALSFSSDDDILDPEEFNESVAMTDAWDRIQKYAEDIILEARGEASRIMLEASDNANAVFASAKAEFDCSANRGFTFGYAKALLEHAHRTSNQAADDLVKVKIWETRLLAIIWKALDRLVKLDDGTAWSGRIRATVDDLLRDTTRIEIRAHRDSISFLEQAFNDWRGSYNDQTRGAIEYIADTAFSDRSCRISYADGVIDFDLQRELDALQTQLATAIAKGDGPK